MIYRVPIAGGLVLLFTRNLWVPLLSGFLSTPPKEDIKTNSVNRSFNLSDGLIKKLSDNFQNSLSYLLNTAKTQTIDIRSDFLELRKELKTKNEEIQKISNDYHELDKKYVQLESNKNLQLYESNQNVEVCSYHYLDLARKCEGMLNTLVEKAQTLGADKQILLETKKTFPMLPLPSEKNKNK